MNKIPSLFMRDWDGDKSLVTTEVTPGCEWVIAGKGMPTEKIDGTACLAKGNLLYKRYDCKKGEKPPEGFIPADEPDEITGHWPGWVLVGDGPDDKWHRESFVYACCDGTYELIGPKVQGNPYRMGQHQLIRHGAWMLYDVPRNYDELWAFLEAHEIEGIVWHHPDGRMAKLKRRDFGLSWPVVKSGGVTKCA